MNKQKTGAWGEELAAEHYIKQGYNLLERNFRVREGEIDVILQKGNCIVFAEVKTRSINAIAQPKEWVTPAKQKKIIKAAAYYLAQSGKNDLFVRFDVVEVVYLKDKKGYNVNCIENAFE